MLRLEEEDIYAGIATSGSGGGGGDTPESAKGSFNASTQQLTLNYDYLVEKINSSDQLTAETKELIIGRLNNSDVVVDMTRDVISIMGQSSDIAWACSDGDPTSEDPAEFPTTMIFVSKSNPETSKLIIPADSGGVVFGSYNAMRAFYELQGQSKTAEEVEALLSSSVVDEEAFTISGTLGNFEVEFIEEAPVVEKFGATISNFLGDVDENGILQFPSLAEPSNLVFTGVKGISAMGLEEHFYHNNSIGSVSFPDLEILNRANAMLKAFGNSTSVTSASFPKLTTISGQSAFDETFGVCTNFTTASFPELTTVSSTYGMRNGFYMSNLTSVSFPKLTTVSGMYGMYNLCSGCSNLTTISFPALTTLSGFQALAHAFYGSKIVQAEFPALSDITGQKCLSELFSNCAQIKSVSFPALTSASFGNYTNQFYNMLYVQVENCTVHFPSNLQSVIGNWSDVTAGFGGTNTTVLFDLPATE